MMTKTLNATAAHSVIREIVDSAENIAAQAGVGSSETAGVIVSFLAERPSLMSAFMAGTLSPVDTGMLDHHNGVLSWHGQDGRIHRPDPSKARFRAPAPEALPADAIGSGVKASDIANCVRCGRVVDTREEKDGGDKFGCELERGGWTCSFECWEAEVDADDDGSGPYGGAKADEEDALSIHTAGAGPVGEVVAWQSGLDAGQIETLRSNGLKPEEIAGDPSKQEARVRELLRWFVRFADGDANPKWATMHAFELAYFIAIRPAEEPGEVERLVEETGSSSVDDLRDMALVGHSLRNAIHHATQDGPFKDWTPAEDPAEIVADLVNALAETRERLEKREEALREIARQKKTDELETEYDAETASFEDGYDLCIDRARAALTGDAQEAGR